MAPYSIRPRKLNSVVETMYNIILIYASPWFKLQSPQKKNTFNLYLECVTFPVKFFITKRNYRNLLHNGHEPCLMSHLSMHGMWNIWWQWGKLLTVSPIWKSWSCTNLQCQFKLWLYFVMFDILKKIQTNVFGKVKLSLCLWCIIA